MNKYYNMTEVESELCQMDSYNPIKRILQGLELHDLQCIDVIKMVVRKRGIVIYDTGCGKTLLASAFMRLLWNEDLNRKFIFFAKKDQLVQTPKKIEAATGRKVLATAADANSLSKVLSQDYTKYDVLMLTHDCLHNERILDSLYRVKDQYCGIIIDEGHELNNHTHASSAQMLSALVSKFEYCWALTATPIITNLTQLTKLAALVDSEHFSNYRKLAQDIARIPSLIEELGSSFIVRGGEDFGGVRDYRGRVRWVEPMKHQLESCAGVAQMFSLFKGDGAYNQVEALVDEIKQYRGKRGLVYVNQHKVREWILPFLDIAGIKYECINGNTSQKERERIMYEFNTLKSLDIVITSVTTAVDLDCDFVIFYEFTVNVKQMIGRAHRGLGSKTLDVIYIITEDSDEIVFFVNNIWNRCELTQAVLGQSFSGLDGVRRSVEEKYA